MNSRFNPDRRPSRAGALQLSLIVALALFAGCDAAPTAAPGPIAPGDNSTATASADTALLVGFTSEPGATGVALVESLGGQVSYQYKYIDVLAITLPQGQVETLSAEPSVAYVEPDGVFEPYGGMQITDWGVAKVDAPGAWDAGHNGSGVKVGIFDSGIDIDHRDLKVAGGVDMINDGHGLDDCQGHGTHVAGIVAARANGHHTVGVAPGVELYSMRFADCLWEGATQSRELAALEWAIDNGMDVVNMSFGLIVPVPSQAEEAAMNAARDAGIVLIAASGNSSAPAVGYPAAYEAVIAVGATDDQDNLATFSQFGTEQELTAPGVNNLASYLMGLGQETTLTVDTDGDRELEAIALEFAGKTSKKGITSDAVYAGLGTIVDFQAVDCTDRIAVYARGGGSFAETTQNAMNAGCAAVVIHNHTPGNFNGSLGTETTTDGRAWIPAVSVNLEDGLYLKDQIEAQPTVLTLINDNGNLAVLSGTSMASPHAAGVAALIRGANPMLSVDQVRQVLRESSVDLGLPGWDPQFGYGRIDARRAVELAQ